eukprot:c46544_g1_i1 orf=41-190(-)
MGPHSSTPHHTATMIGVALSTIWDEAIAQPCPPFSCRGPGIEQTFLHHI